jgi:hypothetical protein
MLPLSCSLGDSTRIPRAPTTLSSETEDLSNGENLVVHEVEETNTIYGGVAADVGFFF